MKAVRLKYCLNLFLLCANTSEKMASHWAGHCLILYCLFGAGYPQIQPPFICLLQLPPSPAYQSPRPPAALGANGDFAVRSSTARGEFTEAEPEHLRPWAPVQKKRLWNGRISIEFWTSSGWISKWTQSKHKPNDWDMTHKWVTSSTAALEAQWGSPIVLLSLVQFHLLE